MPAKPVDSTPRPYVRPLARAEFVTRRRLLVGSLVLVALAVRLVLAFTLSANGDIDNERRVAQWLAESPLRIYRREPPGVPTWPYLPGYFPVLALARDLSSATGLGFAALVRIPVILANLLLAWLVDGELRRVEVDGRRRLVAMVGLLFGPLLVLESGWHGQLDSVAALFAAAALVVWERSRGDARALGAGALIGVAALIKTPLGITLIPVAVNVRTRRELVLLVAAAGLITGLVSAPWLIAEGHALRARLGYDGIPGIGGLSILVQRSLATFWLNGSPVKDMHVQLSLQAHAQLLTFLAAGVTSVFLLLTRPRPAVGAVLLFLSLYVSAADLLLQYFIWILPCLMLAGWTGAAGLLQLALIPPVALLYPVLMSNLRTHPWSTFVTRWIYVPWMDVTWAACGLAFLWVAWRSWHDRPRRSPRLARAAA